LDDERFLNILSQIPNQYKTDKIKPLVIQILLEKAHNRIGRRKSKEIIRSYIISKRSYLSIHEPKDVTDSILYNDLRNLELLNRKYNSTEAIIEALSGIPDTDVPDLDEISLDDEKKNYIDELIANPITFKIGSLVRHIWSGLHIPFHFHSPSEQPMGGVSDISNKGNFDRLLISEFANDDEVFMSRILNQEALYIQREIPPQDNKKTRYLLIDSSLKNWGIPKTIAYALSIAIAKHPRSNIETKIYIIGQQYRECVYETVDLLIDSIDWLSPRIDAAEGLHAFFHEETIDSGKEVFILSCKESMESLSFQAMINQYIEQINYWLISDREGVVNVYKKTNRTKKHTQEFKLPLKEFWHNNEKNASSPIPREKKQYNAINDILYPYPQKITYCIEYHENIFIIDKHHSLYVLTKNSNNSFYTKGAQLVCEELPKQITEKTIVQKNKDGDLIFVSISQQSVVHYINIDKKIKIETQFPDIKFPKVQSLHYQNGKFIVNNNFIKYELFIDDKGELGYTVANISIDKTNPTPLYIRSMSLLTNIKNVYFNSRGELCVNKHALMYNEKYDTIFWGINTDDKKVETPTYSDTYQLSFVFNNQCEIKLDERGLLILSSPKGNDLQDFHLILENAGTERLQVIHHLQSISQQSLAQRKQQVDTPNSVIHIANNLGEAEKIKREIESISQSAIVNIGFSKRLENKIIIPMALDVNIGVLCGEYFAGNSFYLPVNNSKEIINTGLFYKRFIQKFIQDINQA